MSAPRYFTADGMFWRVLGDETLYRDPHAPAAVESEMTIPEMSVGTFWTEVQAEDAAHLFPSIQPRLVRLIQCGRRSCGHVLTEDERPLRRDDDRRSTCICPKCGEDSFYTLNEKGQSINQMSYELDPSTIEPSPRMGPKMKARILDAKRRAMQSINAETTQNSDQ